MATITANLTTLNDAENTSTTTGNKPVLDPDIKKEGSNSMSFTVTNQNKYAALTFSSTDLSNQHIRIWYTSILGSYMKTKALGGMSFYVKDSSNNESYWYIHGSDTYQGGWINICQYLNYTDYPTDNNSGTDATLTDIVEAGILHDFATSPRNVINCWVDYLRYGDGLTVYGTPSFSIADVASDDATNGYGIVEEFQGVYYISGSLIIGDTGTNQTIYNDSNKILVFSDKSVSSTLYKIEGVGNGTGDTDITFSNSVITSASPIFDLDFDSADIESATITGCQISGADSTFLNSVGDVTNTTFNACGQIQPTTSTFTNNTISNTTSTTGALLYPTGTDNTSDCSFISNGNAVEIDTAGTSYSFDGHKFTSNTVDINNTSGGTVEVALVGGANAITETNDTTITSEIQLELTGLQTGSEVRIYTGTPGASAVEIGGTESTTGSTYSITHSSGDVAGFIIIHKTGYEHIKIELTFSSNDQSIPIQQRFDRNYSNPS